ncbi:Uncharacterized protein FWK35_00031367 [Aphis craccivora]|uniref:Uncharacterized protein n=1 Tax=Aphis craccivora TaxID=307492 RepID=A0A6G0ZI77_APHCR|nr:Uncharacterized protein FWK35_00031367 [Aphis craccivora]
MSTVAAEWLGKFSRSACAVFDERTQKLCDALAKEQVAPMLQYERSANDHPRSDTSGSRA